MAISSIPTPFAKWESHWPLATQRDQCQLHWHQYECFGLYHFPFAWQGHKRQLVPKARPIQHQHTNEDQERVSPHEHRYWAGPAYRYAIRNEWALQVFRWYPNMNISEWANERTQVLTSIANNVPAKTKSAPCEKCLSRGAAAAKSLRSCVRAVTCASTSRADCNTLRRDPSAVAMASLTEVAPSKSGKVFLKALMSSPKVRWRLHWKPRNAVYNEKSSKLPIMAGCNTVVDDNVGWPRRRIASIAVRWVKELH